jgi:transmembrane sensor
VLYRAGLGERTTVRLSDGSTMMLAAGSHARVMSEKIRLTGEAYFIVNPSSRRAFIVETENAFAQVLGTRFTVRQHANESRSLIVVEDGRVAVSRRLGSSGRDNVVVAANGLAVVTDSGVAITPNVDSRTYTSWTQGLLTFEGAPLRDVVSELARAYGVEIRVSDTLLARRTIGLEVSVTKDRITQVLESICNVTDARYTRSGKGYLLQPGRTGSRANPAPSPRVLTQPEKQYGR